MKKQSQNLYGTCAFAVLEDQQRKESKKTVTLEVTEELLNEWKSVGVEVVEEN